MTRKMIGAGLLVIAIGMFLAACSSDAGSEPVIEDAWARPGAPGDNSAAYMVVRNDGDEEFKVVGASADVANTVEIHESAMEDGMMQMKAVDEIVVPGGESEQLEPGGYHVMMMDLTEDLEPGDTFTLSLQFDGLEDVQVDVTVEEQ